MPSKLNPVDHPDWEIAEDAEQSMKPVTQIAKEMGLQPDELLPHGHYVAKVDF